MRRPRRQALGLLATVALIRGAGSVERGPASPPPPVPPPAPVVLTGSQPAGGYAGPGVCRGDVNGDGATGVADLLLILAAFGGQCVLPATSMAEDLTADCTVSVADILVALGAFGEVCSGACTTTAAHRSTLSSVESLFPCEPCVDACYTAFGTPNWDDPAETCAFVDQVYSTNSHDTCLDVRSATHHSLIIPHPPQLDYSRRGISKRLCGSRPALT